MASPVVVEGTVTRIAFHNPENGYAVLRLEPDRDPSATVVGTFYGLRPGDRVRVWGEWVEHPAYGRQLRAEGYELIAPGTLKGIEAYLASGRVKGIGRALAGRLVAHFGLDTLRALEEDPDRVAAVPGIGAKRARALAEAVRNRGAVEKTLVFLQGHGVSLALASRLVARYGERTLQRVREDPFSLIREVRGIGFRTADRIAREVGVKPEAPARLRAGLLFELEEAVARGHVYLPRQELVARAAGRLEVAGPLLEAAVDSLVQGGELHQEEWGGERALYPPSFQRMEAGLARCLLELARQPLTLTLFADDTPEPPGAPGPLSPEQAHAVGLALRSGVALITGGPGTGKTTLVRALAARIAAGGGRLLLASPTGRAAKRLSEATGCPASTVHRLLEVGFHPSRGLVFARGRDNPLVADWVLVDEASMLDLALAYRLVQAIRPPTRLVLVGDSDQLPPVGPGAVLRDSLAAGVLPTARLSHVFRQAASSPVVVNAHRIRQGLPPLLGESDFFFLPTARDRLGETVVELVATRLPRYLGCGPESIQVLTPVRRGPAGTVALNAALQERLNPLRAGSAQASCPGGGHLRAGDRVIQMENDYTLPWRRVEGAAPAGAGQAGEEGTGVFNGELGRVLAVLPRGGVRVLFDGERVVDYPRERLSTLQLAYAVTVHRAQGSEFPAVVMPLVWTSPDLMTRNLLYTAVTRARRCVVLVGEKEALRAYIRNDRVDTRYSHLADRLRA